MGERGDISQLIAKAERLPYSDVQVSMLEEAVKEADTARDLDLMFSARLALSNSAVFSGHGATSLAAFAWCLAQFKEDPDRFHSQQFTLLWRFKNVLMNVDEFPQITRTQYEELQKQMEQLYRNHGYNVRPICDIRLHFAISMGDRDMAADAYQGMHAVPRDAMADCLACEIDTAVRYHNFLGDWEKAVETAKEIVAGTRRCAEVPHRTYGQLLKPLAILGRVEEADVLQQKDYRLIRNTHKFLKYVALQIFYLVHRNKLPSATRMLERHMIWALQTRQLRSRYLYYLAAEALLHSLAERKGTFKLKLPREFPAYDATAKYEAKSLIGWFERERRELGNRFRERDGNNYTAEQLPGLLRY